MHAQNARGLLAIQWADCTTQTKTPPRGRRLEGADRAIARYFTWLRMNSTVALICASFKAGLPPFGGMTPLLPV